MEAASRSGDPRMKILVLVGIVIRKYLWIRSIGYSRRGALRKALWHGRILR